MTNPVLKSLMGLVCATVLPVLGQESGSYPMDNAVTVFNADSPVENGGPYASIRIPALINIGTNHLLAFAEGRYKNTDQGQNDIIMSSSTDGGKTWSPTVVIAKSNGATFNNPCPVYDAQTKTVTMVFQRYPQGVREHTKDIPHGWDDPRCIRNFMIQSKDGGKTWSEPKDITPTTKRPAGVDIMATGPNPGVQIRYGKDKGRLVIPMNEGPFGKWDISCIYSDDNGNSWKLGQATKNMKGQVNETSIAETDNGLVMVARHWGPGKARKIVWSTNGGESWGNVENAPDLFCDSTQNGLVTYSLSKQASLGSKSRIIFTGPSKQRRLDGQIALSYDNGKTWPIRKVLGTGGFAYSSVAPVAPGSVGVLYEENSPNIKLLKFVPVTIEWLTDGKDSGVGKKKQR